MLRTSTHNIGTVSELGQANHCIFSVDTSCPTHLHRTAIVRLSWPALGPTTPVMPTFGRWGSRYSFL